MVGCERLVPKAIEAAEEAEELYRLALQVGLYRGEGGGRKGCGGTVGLECGRGCQVRAACGEGGRGLLRKRAVRHAVLDGINDM